MIMSMIKEEILKEWIQYAEKNNLDYTDKEELNKYLENYENND